MIPDKTMEEIFLRCLPTEQGRRASLNPEDAPVLLTHVCRRWREIAINQAPLWTLLRIRPSPWFFTQQPSLLLEIASDALKRSAGYSHRLELHIPYTMGYTTPSNPPLFLKPLLMFNGALTTLTLRKIPPIELVDLRRGLFPSLESLALSFPVSLAPGEVLKLQGKGIDAFGDAPNLRRVAVDCSIHCDFAPDPDSTTLHMQISLPWSQITHLFRMSRESSIRKALEDCLATAANRLRYLSLELGQDDFAHLDFDFLSSNLPVTQYSNVESLTISTSASGRGIRYPLFFEDAAFPNLKNFRIQGLILDFDLMRLSWPTFLEERFIGKLREFKHLEYLSLCVLSANPATLERILSAVPQVKTLDLQIYNNYRSIFETLTYQCDPADSLLPGLHTLVIEAGWSEAHDRYADDDVYEAHDGYEDDYGSEAHDGYETHDEDEDHDGYETHDEEEDHDVHVYETHYEDDVHDGYEGHDDDEVHNEDEAHDGYEAHNENEARCGYKDIQTIDATAFEAFLESRTQCPDEFRLRKVVVYGSFDGDVNETIVDFIRCLNSYRSRGLEVELRVVMDQVRGATRILSDTLWVDRDPILAQWPEVSVVA